MEDAPATSWTNSFKLLDNSLALGSLDRRSTELIVSPRKWSGAGVGVNMLRVAGDFQFGHFQFGNFQFGDYNMDFNLEM